MLDYTIKRKTCMFCLEHKEANSDNFFENLKSPDGLQPYCKTCQIEYKLAPTTRQCTICKEVKPLTSEYWYRKNTGKYGFASFCSDCDAKKSSEWRANNPERIKENYVRWYSENKERHHEYQRGWYLRNRERDLANKKAKRNKAVENARHKAWVLLNQEKYAQYKREWTRRNRTRLNQANLMWLRNNPEKSRAMKQNRRAKKAQGGIHTGQDIQRIYLEQHGLCAYCGIELNGKYEVDHIMPLSRGGSNSPENLCCACQKCNRSKHNKTVDEWKKSRGW